MIKPKLDLSIIIPVLDEEESLPELIEWIVRVVQKENLDYELIFIDDGSQDASWERIQEASDLNPAVKGIRFNRNYGKSAALNTGFQVSSGRIIITMDADLQDSPDEIPKLIESLQEKKLHLVSGWKKKRFDPISKTIPSKFFNYVTSRISGIPIHDFNCGLKAYDFRVIKSIHLYGEMHRYIPFIAKWHGFDRIDELVVQHRPRKYGRTKFGLERFIFGFLDLVSISFVSKFKKRPMHFFGSLGTLSFIFGSILTFYLILEKIVKLKKNIPVRELTDQPLFFLALVALIIGVQLFLAGFLGELQTQVSGKKSDYLIIDKANLDKDFEKG